MKLLPPGPGEGEVVGLREAGRALGPGGVWAGEEFLSWGSDATGQAGGGSKPAGSLGPATPPRPLLHNFLFPASFSSDTVINNLRGWPLGLSIGEPEQSGRD